MNKTKIEWTRGPNGEPGYTWNPVTGCLHNCPYCYARRIAERFRPQYPLGDDCTQPGNGLYEIRYNRGGAAQSWRYGFAPTFHSHRISDPKYRRKPARIFAVSMGDLFGDWVPREWIDAVMETVRTCPQHIFIFLTKNPARYVEIDWPENAWAGVTVEDQKLAEKRIAALIQANAAVRFVSAEPLLSRLDLQQDYDPIGGLRTWLDMLDWVIVGAQTGPGAMKPSPGWIWDIIQQCRDAAVPLFIKDNVGWPKQIQEFPDARQVVAGAQ